MAAGIITVDTGRQLREFIQFPHRLHKDDPNYVPALFLAEKWMLGGRNPFLKHSRIRLFLAKEDGRTVGRMAAIYNKAHLDVHGDDTGFFGFFDAANDPGAARALFAAAAGWLKEQGLKRMVGPANLTTNDSCGMLVQGFDRPPMVLMPYNPGYYNQLCLGCGLKKAVDLYSYEIDGTAVTGKYRQLLERCARSLSRQGIRIRPVDTGNFGEEMSRLRTVYNKCNENNWGFIPLNEDEFNAMARDIRMVSPPDLALVAEKDGKLIGFVIALPDINQALKHVANGKLLPFGFLKLLWHKRRINKARILILGVLDGYSGMGVDLVLYKHIKEALNSHHIFMSEACYVMETNARMNSILNKLQGKIVKTYRMYQADLA